MSQYQTAGEIASELYTRVASIRLTNGYETDIGRLVYRGVRKVEDDAVPCATVIEGQDVVTSRPGRLPAANIDQGYLLGGYAPCDPANPNDTAHKIIRDLKKAIFKGNATLDGKVPKVEYRGRDIGPRTDGVAIVFALIEITISYVEDLTSP